MRGRYKPWAQPYLEEHSELVCFDPHSICISKPKDLELGSGKGDFAIARCLSNPERHLLALERDVSIAGLFAKKAVE